MPNLYIIYVFILLNITDSFFTTKRHVKMMNLDKYLPSIIQYSEFLNNKTNIDYPIIQNDKLKGIDMHIIQDIEKEREILEKIIKHQSFLELLYILESNQSNNYKIDEINKHPFLEESYIDKIRPVQIKSGGLLKNWEDDLLFS